MSYTYIIPNSEKINALLPALRNLFGPAINQLRIKQIPEEDFRRLTVGHIAIYNPNMEGRNAPLVFLELPIENRGYWVKVDQDAALGLTGRFRMIVENEIN